MDYLFGAHFSIAGGYDKALQRAIDIGGNCLQIFSASPRIWSFARPSEEDIERFKRVSDDLGVGPVYFHASYLVNLADPARVGQLSTNLLIHELKLASALGIKGTIIHLGSYKGEEGEKRKILIKNIQTVLEKTPEDTFFIAENAGNNKIGQKLEELASIVKEVDHPRLRICLDTCHLHGGGYDITSQSALNSYLKDFDTQIGLEKLEVWQLNDSRDPLASGRDRHENIGEGTMGVEAFRALLNHPKMKHLPFILETPGFDGLGPDKKNVDILKSLV